MNSSKWNEFPIVSVLLLLLTCVRFEYNTETSSLKVYGLGLGIVVLAIVAIIIIFRVFFTVERLCQKKGWLTEHLHHRYDVLIPIGIAAVAVKAQWTWGPLVKSIDGQQVHQFMFQWSDATLDSYFIIGLIVVVLLVRALELIRGIEQSVKPSSDGIA